MPDDSAPAMCACGRELVNRALEAIEGVSASLSANFERLIVVVAANLASGHLCILGPGAVQMECRREFPIPD